MLVDVLTAQENKEGVIKVYENLRDETDTIRRKYWQYKIDSLEK
jgi:hypothetical protein